MPTICSSCGRTSGKCESCIRHSETMLGGILKVAMTPGVLEAIESDRSADLAEQRTGGRE